MMEPRYEFMREGRKEPEQGASLTLKMHDKTVTVAFDYHVLDADELVDAFVVVMQGATFHRDTVTEAMRLWLEENDFENGTDTEHI